VIAAFALAGAGIAETSPRDFAFRPAPAPRRIAPRRQEPLVADRR
jgi:hypothetical protein